MRDEEPPISGINVTPLIDVVLVLLIVLMVAASHASRSIPLELGARGAAGDDVVIEVAIDAEGGLAIDGTPSSWRALRDRARTVGPRARAIVHAHPNAEHGVFVRVIDVLRANGVDRYAVRTP